MECVATPLFCGELPCDCSVKPSTDCTFQPYPPFLPLTHRFNNQSTVSDIDSEVTKKPTLGG